MRIPQVFTLILFDFQRGIHLSWYNKKNIPKVTDFEDIVFDFLISVFFRKRCGRDFNLRNQEISQNCNILIIIKLLQINYITKYH